MTWREMTTKGLWLGGLVGYPAVLVTRFEVGLGKALLGGVALAFVTPIVFVVGLDLVDQLRSPRKPPPPPGTAGPTPSAGPPR